MMLFSNVRVSAIEAPDFLGDASFVFFRFISFSRRKSVR